MMFFTIKETERGAVGTSRERKQAALKLVAKTAPNLRGGGRAVIGWAVGDRKVMFRLGKELLQGIACPASRELKKGKIKASTSEGKEHAAFQNLSHSSWR